MTTSTLRSGVRGQHPQLAEMYDERFFLSHRYRLVFYTGKSKALGERVAGVHKEVADATSAKKAKTTGAEDVATKLQEQAASKRQANLQAARAKAKACLESKKKTRVLTLNPSQ